MGGCGETRSRAPKNDSVKGSYRADAAESEAYVPLWYPEKKLSIALRKLEGKNSACEIQLTLDLTIEELESGHRGKPYLAALKRALQSGRWMDIGEQCKDPSEQVDCLLLQASDRNLLGRMWTGWQSWI